MADGLLKVQLSADAYLACITHALSAEKEEIMGVLLGEVSSMHEIDYWICENLTYV